MLCEVCETAKNTGKDRSDMKVDTFEKKHSLPLGTIRSEIGKETRGDKMIGTIRKETNK